MHSHPTGRLLYANQVARKEDGMSEANSTNGARKKKQKSIHSKHARSALLYAKFAQFFTEVLEDQGMYSDTQLEELARDRGLVRTIVRMLRRRKVCLSNDAFSMVSEPEGRRYDFTYRQGGPLIEMVNEEFPEAEYWFKNWLPGISGGYFWQHCSQPPEGTPADRRFAVFVVRRKVYRAEAERIIKKSGWHQACLYDLFHVREWVTPHPLFVLASGQGDFPCLLPNRILAKHARREFLEEGDRLLVWRQKRIVT